MTNSEFSNPHPFDMMTDMTIAAASIELFDVPDAEIWGDLVSADTDLDLSCVRAAAGS